MNSNYYTPPVFPNNNSIGENTPMTNNNMLPEEQSYVENILRLNQGKLATLYFSFPDSIENRDKIFSGIIEAAGRDHIIISDPKTGKWYLLLMVYLNYVEFQEKINYSPTYYPNNR